MFRPHASDLQAEEKFKVVTCNMTNHAEYQIKYSISSLCYTTYRYTVGAKWLKVAVRITVQYISKIT
jgi:hypothetical protein